jgi:sRNA-binding regulator protein Hfq
MDVLHNTHCEFGNPMKLVGLIKMYLNEKYSRVRVEKYLSGVFLFKNGLKKEMVYRHCFSTLL